MSNEIKKIMHNKAYRDYEFNNDRTRLAEFIKNVNELQIRDEFFKIIRILIRFFRFPILVLFNPMYKRIEQQKEQYLSKYHEEIIKTAGIVKAIIKTKNYHTLQFYFRAGCSNDPIELKQDPHQEMFMNYILVADRKLKEKNGDMFEQDRKLKELQDYLRNGINNTQIVLEKLCVQYYLNMVETRRQQICREFKFAKTVTPPTFSPTPKSKISSISMQIKPQTTKPKVACIKIQGTQERQIDDQNAEEPLCCRSYFYESQIINEPETIVQQYKNYEYPFDRSLGDTLLKTICGFLNARGGIIYIGIKEVNSTKKRVVVGQKYTENSKQDLLKYFRIICEKISPEIVNQQLYKLQFVPLKNPNRKNEWVAGKYVARLRITMGNQKELYSFKKSDGDQLFAFRTENEVLCKRMGQQIIEIYRKRLTTNEQRVGYIKHNGPCKPVEMGKQLCELDSSQNKIELPWNNNSRNYGNPGLYKKEPKKMDEEFKKCAFACFPNALTDDLKKFKIMYGKNGWIFIQPREKEEESYIEMIINRNRPIKITKISRAIEVQNATMSYIDQLLEKRLCNTYGNTILIKTFDQVMEISALLKEQNIQFDYLF